MDEFQKYGETLMNNIRIYTNKKNVHSHTIFFKCCSPNAAVYAETVGYSILQKDHCLCGTKNAHFHSSKKNIALKITSLQMYLCSTNRLRPPKIIFFIKATTAIQVTGCLKRNIGNNKNIFKNVIPEGRGDDRHDNSNDCPVKIVNSPRYFCP